MNWSLRRKLTLTGAAGILALAGITGVVRHSVVHAAPPAPAVTQKAPAAQDGDTVQQQDVSGTDAAGTEAPDAADTGAADATAEATAPETDATAPCTGSGATQAGNCDTQDTSGN